MLSMSSDGNSVGVACVPSVFGVGEGVCCKTGGLFVCLYRSDIKNPEMNAPMQPKARMAMIVPLLGGEGFGGIEVDCIGSIHCSMRTGDWVWQENRL